MKTCSGCGQSKPLEEFHRWKPSPDGRRARCKDCRSVYSKVYHARNRTRINARTAAWRKAHPEEFRAGLRSWSLRNPDRKRRMGQEHYRRNIVARRAYEATPARRAYHRENAAVQNGKRRAARLGTRSERITAADWRVLKESYLGLCIYCLCRPPRLTMDHLDALSRGGDHSLHNTAPACRSCNSAKGAKSILLFLATRGIA